MTAAETSAALALYEGLYGRTGADRVDDLIDAADALQSALQTLRTHPTPEGCERIATQLMGMHRHAMQAMVKLSREAVE